MASNVGDESEVGLGDEEGGEASRERLTMAVRETFTCYSVTKKGIITPQRRPQDFLSTLQLILDGSDV